MGRVCGLTPEAMEYVNNHHDSLEEDFNNGKEGKR